MIIDVHVHTFPDAIAARALEVLEEKAGHRIRPVSEGTLAALCRSLEESGVDRAVLCPIATKPSQFEGILRVSQGIIAGEFGKDAQEKIIPLASVHPADPQRKEHIAQVAAAGIKGVKLHPFYQGVVLDEPSMLDYLKMCRDNGLVVQCHCGYDVGFANTPVAGPERVHRVIEEVKGIRFIAAHLGGMFQAGGVREHLLGKDVYLDTSLAKFDLQSPEPLSILKEHRADRLLFATDWPWLSFKDGIDYVRSSQRPPEDIAKILGGNAAELFGLR